VPPRRAGAAVVGWVTTVLAAVALAALASGVPAAATARTTWPPIGSVILADALPGFTPAVPGPTNGPLTATGFAAQSPDPQAAARQFGQMDTVPGFAAWLRLWTDLHGPGNGANDVVITLYRIPDAATASTFARGLRQQYAVGATRFAVPSIPGAAGYTVAVTSPSPATEQVVVFRSGAYVVIVDLASSRQGTNPSPLTPAEAVDVSFRQFTATERAGATVTPSPASAPSGGSGDWILGVVVVLLVGAGAGLVVARRRRGARTGGPALHPDPFAPDGILAVMGAVPPPAAPAGGSPAPAPVPGGPTPGATPVATPDGPVPDPGSVPGTRPAWLPDPSGAPDRVRYWDGQAWTPHVAVRAPDH